MCGFVCGFCLALGLSVCWVGNLCLSGFSLSLFAESHFLSQSTSYVWHGSSAAVRMILNNFTEGGSV